MIPITMTMTKRMTIFLCTNAKWLSVCIEVHPIINQKGHGPSGKARTRRPGADLLLHLLALGAAFVTVTWQLSAAPPFGNEQVSPYNDTNMETNSFSMGKKHVTP